MQSLRFEVHTENQLTYNTILEDIRNLGKGLQA